MKELLLHLAGQLVEFPAAVKVEQQGTEDNQRLLLSVDKGDLGKIIGKKGRTIKAMRTFLTAAAKYRGKHVSLEISSSGGAVTEEEEN